MPSIITGIVVEDSGAFLMARVQGANAANVTQADITGVTYSVFDLSSDTPTTALAGHSGATLTVATVIFNTLQTDARWTIDSTGYNFAHAIAASAFPTGNHRFRVEYLFDPASGENFIVPFDLPAIAVYTS